MVGFFFFFLLILLPLSRLAAFLGSIDGSPEHVWSIELMRGVECKRKEKKEKEGVDREQGGDHFLQESRKQSPSLC